MDKNSPAMPSRQQGVTFIPACAGGRRIEMRSLARVGALLVVAAVCHAQPITLRDAQKEIVEAKKELDKAVTFCPHCRATGTIDEKACPHCNGQGALLKSEAEYLAHTRHLEERAERAGARKDNYAAFDVAKRLPALKENLESEALEMLAAYVAYAKVYREHEKLLAEDERFAEKARQVIDLVDKLIDKHAARLNVPCLKMLYDDDPVGKVGAFTLHGTARNVCIDGKNVQCLKLRTLKEYSLLIRNGQARKRNGYILAEILGKQVYTTDDGQKIRAVLLQAY